MRPPTNRSTIRASRGSASGHSVRMPRGAKTILAGLVDPLLPGFERAQYAWNRTRGRVVHVVDLQGSQHGTGDMTVNWGIAPIGWARVMYGEEPSVYLSSECAVDGRLGHLGGGDRWWELDEVRGAVPPDMESLLVDHLLPFFDQMGSPEQLQRLVERGYRPPRRGDPALGITLLRSGHGPPPPGIIPARLGRRGDVM